MNDYTPRTPAGKAMMNRVQQMRSGIQTELRQHQIGTAIRVYRQTGDTRHLIAANITIEANRFRADDTDYGAVS